MCHPYALVKRSDCVSAPIGGESGSEDEGTGDDGGVSLTVTKEVHQWLPWCESTDAAELLQCDDQDDQDDADDESGGVANGHASDDDGDAGRAAVGAEQLASNIKAQVMVDWDADGGPVVTQPESVAFLLSMLTAVEQLMGSKSQQQQKQKQQAKQRKHSQPAKEGGPSTEAPPASSAAMARTTLRGRQPRVPSRLLE